MKSNDWRHKNVARYTPGNTKILYFFNCLLDGMHTMTNSIRDILIGDTISGVMRLVESLLWAGALACGFMCAIWFVGGVL